MPTPSLVDVVRLRRLTLTEGLKADEIATELGCSDDVVEQIIRTAVHDGDMEKFEGRYRLTSGHRSPQVLFSRVASLIRPGEWSSYKDVAEVATGSGSAKQSVGRTASSNPRFSNPHRILMADGRISASWRDLEGNGSSHCRALLESEGVKFRDDDTADPSQHIEAEALRRRWDSDTSLARLLDPAAFLGRGPDW